MRRIDLLPPEERRGRLVVPKTTKAGITGVLLIGGAVLVMLMIALFLFYNVRLNNEEERIAQLDQNITRQQARMRSLLRLGTCRRVWTPRSLSLTASSARALRGTSSCGASRS